VDAGAFENDSHQPPEEPLKCAIKEIKDAEQRESVGKVKKGNKESEVNSCLTYGSRYPPTDPVKTKHNAKRSQQQVSMMNLDVTTEVYLQY